MIVFDPETGETSWVTTNADVTRDVDGSGNPIITRAPYDFRVVADDGWSLANSTNTKDFKVDVWNDQTDIGELSGNTIVPIADKSINEDATLTVNLDSRDERFPTTLIADAETRRENTYWKDSSYDLVIDGFSIYDTNHDGARDIYNPNTALYTVTLNTGGNALTFDKDFGAISWTPNDADAGTGVTGTRCTTSWLPILTVTAAAP